MIRPTVCTVPTTLPRQLHQSVMAAMPYNRPPSRLITRAFQTPHTPHTRTLVVGACLQTALVLGVALGAAALISLTGFVSRADLEVPDLVGLTVFLLGEALETAMV